MDPLVQWYSMSTEYRRAIKYPKLTLSMVQKRLTWASLPKDMALEYWESTHSQVCLSDEATFQIMDDRVFFIRRHPT